MDVSEIVTAYGAYYEKSAANKSRIRKLLTQGLETPQHCTPIKTDDTIYRLAQVTLGSIVQSFQIGWTPGNEAAFTPNELRLHHFKVDQEIYPDHISDTWLAFLESDAVSRQEWPLVRYLIEGVYIPMINSDMELLEYGKGVYETPVPGTASVTGKGMNGLIYQLQAGIDDETINHITLAPLTASNIFDQVELFVDGISQVYQNQTMSVFMSPQWVRAYQRDRRAQGFYTISSEREIGLKVDFTPQSVVGLPSLSGTDVIFSTPKSNLIHLTKKSANKTKFKIEEYHRLVSFYADWWEGLGFGLNAAIWSNLPKTV